jgi:hypothetical protein
MPEDAPVMKIRCLGLFARPILSRAGAALARRPIVVADQDRPDRSDEKNARCQAGEIDGPLRTASPGPRL